jgi:hypothetical protein
VAGGRQKNAFNPIAPDGMKAYAPVERPTDL